MGAEFIIDNLDDMCNLMCDNHYERGKRMTKELIADFRFIVIPYMVNRFKEINFEGQGGSDAEEFKSDFNEICDLAIKALEQEPIKQIYIEREVLDKIRAEIIQSIQNGTLKIESGNEELFRIIDKYKGESEVEDGNDD